MGESSSHRKSRTLPDSAENAAPFSSPSFISLACVGTSRAIESVHRRVLQRNRVRHTLCSLHSDAPRWQTSALTTRSSFQKRPQMTFVNNHRKIFAYLSGQSRLLFSGMTFCAQISPDTTSSGSEAEELILISKDSSNEISEAPRFSEMPETSTSSQSQLKAFNLNKSESASSETNGADRAMLFREGIPDEDQDSETEDSVSEGSHGGGDSRPLLGLVLLNSVAVIWGSQHAVIKGAVDQLSPGIVNLARFGLGAAVFVPFLPGRLDVWLAGIELGLYMFAGYAFQAEGLQFTTASRSAFLLYLNVKFVPILAGLFGRRIAISTWISAAIALAGTGLLAYDGAPPNVGDLWSMSAALVSAFFILRLERFSGLYPAAGLNAVSLMTVAALSGVWVFLVEHVQPAQMMIDISTLGPQLAYLGLITTALSNYMQTIGQKYVSAERAAIIFALDPVYGAAFSYWLLGENLGPQGLTGAALIMVAAAISQLATRFVPAHDTKSES